MRKEDNLFEYAFGDLDAHDAQVFEAGLLRDEVTAEEAKFLQSIKGDLVAFRDIPEMQYSKERLRHAILGQGLKPSRPGFPWLNWVLAPGAVACVFALGYVLMNGTARKDPTLIGSPNMASTSNSGLKLPEQKLTGPTPEVAVNETNLSPSGFPNVRDSHWASDADFSSNMSTARSSSKSHANRNRGAGSYVAFRTIDKFSNALKVESIHGPSMPAGGGGASLIGPIPLTSPDLASVPVLDSTIILIDKDQDSGLGAPMATEISDTKNVVIGG